MLERQTAEQGSAHGSEGKILPLVKAETEVAIVNEKGV